VSLSDQVSEELKQKIEHYLETVTKAKNREVARAGLDLKRVYQLFPGGPGKGACKVAGLPKPTGCV
jgi:tRNA 2-thiouridine synthesizing protein E